MGEIQEHVHVHTSVLLSAAYSMQITFVDFVVLISPEISCILKYVLKKLEKLLKSFNFCSNMYVPNHVEK